MSRFTKGDWVYWEDADGFFTINAPDQLIAQTIARTFGTEAEDKANARLISQAPRMYELLEECADAFECIDCHELSDKCYGLLKHIDNVETAYE